MSTPFDSTASPPIAGFVSQTIAIDGVQLHYWRGGPRDGAPVLLWHGFLETGYAWRHVMQLLAQAGLDVLVPDMRGYGDSDKPAGVDGYDARALGQEFRALARAIGFGASRPIVLVAHDMGAPPALMWAADHPDEIGGLIYMEMPAMLLPVLQQIITYSPEAMRQGSMWWWILPLAPDVPERLVVGHERAFLMWFYERYLAAPGDVDLAAIDEYLRSFSGREGVLGAMGVYRAAFASMAQVGELTTRKIRTKLVAVGGESSLGAQVGAMMAAVAQHVATQVLPQCGHFPADEQPHDVARLVLNLIEPAV